MDVQAQDPRVRHRWQHLPLKSFTSRDVTRHRQFPALKTVLFRDDLSQWRSEWDAVSDTSDGKIFYSGGSLHIRDNNPLTETTEQRLNKNYNDFILDIDTKLVGGSLDNWQGLYFRRTMRIIIMGLQFPQMDIVISRNLRTVTGKTLPVQPAQVISIQGLAQPITFVLKLIKIQ